MPLILEVSSRIYRAQKEQVRDISTCYVGIISI